MDKNYLVTKSNYFIMNSSYDLSLEEQKIILTLASMVQPDDEDFKPYKFRIADFMELIGVEDKSKYTQIPKVTKDLMKKVFEIQEGDTLIQTAWLSGAKYKKGSGTVELTFSSYLKPYMLKLNSMFTQYKLANILSMKSKYSPRIYEILKCNEFKKQGYIEIEIDDLRKLLKADETYPRYYDFRRFVLEAAQKELKALTDLSFEFEEIRYGRKVTSIKFTIKSTKSKALDEVSATLIEPMEKAPAEMNIQEGIQAVIKIMDKHSVQPSEAMRIWNSSNGDIKLISKVYNHFKDKQASNFVGLMVDMVKPGAFNEPIKNAGGNNFNNYQQRTYDFDNLERKLLGWDNKQNEGTGEEYLQGKFEVKGDE